MASYTRSEARDWAREKLNGVAPIADMALKREKNGVHSQALRARWQELFGRAYP